MCSSFGFIGVAGKHLVSCGDGIILVSYMSNHPGYLSCQLLEAVATSFPLGNTVDPAVTELDLLYQAPSLPNGSVPVKGSFVWCFGVIPGSSKI